MEIEGRLIQKLGIQSGKSARGDWAKQERWWFFAVSCFLEHKRVWG